MLCLNRVFRLALILGFPEAVVPAMLLCESDLSCLLLLPQPSHASTLNCLDDSSLGGTRLDGIQPPSVPVPSVYRLRSSRAAHPAELLHDSSQLRGRKVGRLQPHLQPLDERRHPREQTRHQ